MNNLSILNNQVLTMSSREIAELTGKRHDSVLRDIRNMLDEIQSPQKCGDYQDARGRSQPMLLLNKEETLCLVAGYNVKLRMAIIKRWQELEAQQAPRVPQTFSEALQLVADQAKQLELQAPKVAFVDRLVTRTNLMNATQIAQKHGKSAVWLNKYLDEKKVYNQSVKRVRTFNSWFVEKGLGEMKKSETGFDQALFTNAGEVWINEQLHSDGMV